MPGCGEILRQERQRRGWSIEEVQRRTLIAVNYLILIEDEKWLELPEDALSRGYVKRYAQLMGFNTTEIWAEVEKARGGPQTPRPSMVPSPRPPETGAVRLVVKEAPAELSLFEAGDEENQELQDGLKVIAAHILNDADTSRAMRNSGTQRRRRTRPTSVSAIGPDGQLPLINSRSEPGSRVKVNQLRPTVSRNLLDDQEETQPDEAKGRLESREIGEECLSEQIARRSVSSFSEEGTAKANIDEMKRKQSVDMQRKRLLRIQRKRLLLSLFFWFCILALTGYIVFFVQDGRIWQQIISYFSQQS